MANLIEQQNKLKSFSDEELQGEGNNPTGNVPPFLVMTELGRRKSMRDAYTAQSARRKPSTTVAEDLLSAPIGSPARPAMGQGAPMGGGGIGIAAALPQGGAPDVPAFANGGLVGDDILKRITDRRMAGLDAVDNDRGNLRGRTLIAAGAAMMSGGSSNFMKNLGAGLGAGGAAWDEGTKLIDSRESDALNGLAGVHSAEQAERLAQLDENFRQSQEARLTSQFETTQNAPTADIKNYDFFSGLDPAEQADFMTVNRPGSAPGGSADRARAMTAYANLTEDNTKAVRESFKYALMDPDPAAKAAAEAQVAAEVKKRTDAQFAAIYTDYAALMPELTASAPGGTATPAAGAQDWSTYF